MKKTQFALAALALVASTAAFAETTVYGTLEAAVGNTTSSNNTSQGVYFAGAGGWVAGNNIGFKGSEEIDSNLKATYQLEAGLNLNQGGTGDNGGSGQTFSRISTIGLSSTSAGSFTFGQQLSPYIAAQAMGTAGNGHFFVNRIIMGGGLNNAAVGSTAAGQGGFFMPNAVVWTSPSSVAGISATFMSTFRNDAQGAAINQGTPADSYRAGMLNGVVFNDVSITLGFQNRQDTYRSYTGSASYTLSPEVTLSGNYTQHTDEGQSAVNSYSGSVAYKYSAPLTLTAQYASNNLTQSQSLFNLGAQYSLSKRTSAFATWARGTNGAQSVYDNRVAYTANTVTTSSSSTVVGLIHSF